MRTLLPLLLVIAPALPALAQTCPDGETVPGIDVSKWQGEVDWDAVAASGVRFAFIRTNHGLYDVDERFDENWAGARAAGVRRGAYQFFLPWQDPIEQAELLLDMMGPLEPGDLPPVIDVEVDEVREAEIYDLDPVPPTTTPAHWRAAIWAFVLHVEAELGVKPIIYSYQYYWNTRLEGTSVFDEAGYPFWFANYNVECPTLPSGWSDWQIWQTSSTGEVPGITGPVDTNLFNGDEAALAAFAVPAPAPQDAGPAPEVPDADDAGLSPEPEADAGPAPDNDAGVSADDDDRAPEPETPEPETPEGCAATPAAPLALLLLPLLRRRRRA